MRTRHCEHSNERTDPCPLPASRTKEYSDPEHGAGTAGHFRENRSRIAHSRRGDGSCGRRSGRYGGDLSRNDRPSGTWDSLSGEGEKGERIPSSRAAAFGAGAGSAHRKPGGSISDRIRSLSGKAYDVYREIFLERVRSDIHHHLLANQTRSHGIFDTAANEAEDQIFGFMAAHYDDPFMDWEHSAGRDAVESFGFSVPSLDPIIEACFKRL